MKDFMGLTHVTLTNVLWNPLVSRYIKTSKIFKGERILLWIESVLALPIISSGLRHPLSSMLIHAMQQSDYT